MLAIVVASGCAFITSPTRTPQLAPRRDGALLPRAVPTAMARVDLPTVAGVDGPLVQTLATVCAKLYDHSLFTVFKPVGDAPVNDKLEQPYKLVKVGGEYNEGGTYTGGVYTDGEEVRGGHSGDAAANDDDALAGQHVGGVRSAAPNTQLPIDRLFL